MMTVYNCKATESMVNFAIIHGKLLDNFTALDCLESDFLFKHHRDKPPEWSKG